MRLYITERLINLNETLARNGLQCMGLSILEALTKEETLVATVFVLVAQHCAAQEQYPGGLHPSSSLAGKTCLLITSTVRDVNCEGHGY